jgi:hypothetical protein
MGCRIWAAIKQALRLGELISLSWEKALLGRKGRLGNAGLQTAPDERRLKEACKTGAKPAEKTGGKNPAENPAPNRWVNRRG